ncbi:hypothetical protein DYB37_010208 [Aphanomyces astaci]|uniref:Uncharacterized protein n=2 Tax=Aphanomyces astaci TaxID=112090 RepID=A0A3R7C2Q9_APHAT|nr:hypothetical protein DYB35_009752 [Aphanomyces astaci]RHZ12647.1 hypothetical protein DYB37_010208 [Aphanomyces astaci]
MDSGSTGSNQSTTVFLTETKVARHAYPTPELADVEPLVSGVSLMSQSTLLLKKRKELREINDALDFMKEEYAQRVETCAERQREFERKQEEMREQVAKFEKFIKENDSKRTRAELKAKTEHRSAEQNDVRKKQLVLQLDKDVASRESLEKRRDQLLKYRTYLDSAVEASEQEYEEIADILNRHATLLDANNDLKAQVQSAESQSKTVKSMGMNEHTTLTERMHERLCRRHQQHLEKIRGETFQLDLGRGRDDRISNDRSRESGQIVLAIKNLYNRCRTSGKIPPVKETPGETMVYMTAILKVVAERIVDLDFITTSYAGTSGGGGGSGGNPCTSQSYSMDSPQRYSLAPPPGMMPLGGVEIDISSLSLDAAGPIGFRSISQPPQSQPEAEPMLDHHRLTASSPRDGSPRPSSPPLTSTTVLPATFLKTICDQLEFYFCDDNLLGDLFLLKNMNADGYVKLELLASFGRVKKLTTDLDLIKQALELSTKLLLSEDALSVCRKDPLPYDQTYHGKLARTAIAFNLAEDASIASLKEAFRTCGEISYLRLLKKNGVTGRNAVLKPPIAAGETYAIIEFEDPDMTNHAVLTLSDQYNWRTGMQVVLFDGTTTDKLKQRMFPVDTMDPQRRGRAKSAAAAFITPGGPRLSVSSSSSSSGGGASTPVHVDAVGEGLNDLSEGKVSTGTVFSIRGAGGLITPARQDGSSISFRLVPDDDGLVDIRQGDYVSFTVGKNKKSGRKYASKVKLEFRPPSNLPAWGGLAASSPRQDRSSGRYEIPASRHRAQTVDTATSSSSMTRGRSISTGQNNLPRPRLPLKSPEAGYRTPSSTAESFRQAMGPDGTRGFGETRQRQASHESAAFAQELSGRRRAASSTMLPPSSFY